MTLGELKRRLLGLASTLDTPSLEARLILEHLGFSQIAQITDSAQVLEDETIQKAIALMEKRLSGYPMAYILGEKEFWGLTFRVNENVLIPRPDTETLVETALQLAGKEGRILDLCTGSGAIATALAYTMKRPVAMSDISQEALDVAVSNYERLTGYRAEARLGDLLSPWEKERFSLIVSNPPYLTEEWYNQVDEDVKKEPRKAFVGFGEDGLDLIRKIVEQAKDHLEANGYLAFECDFRQCGPLSELLAQQGFTGVNIIKDLAGKDRVVYGRRTD